jgi:hypothetical protein
VTRSFDSALRTAISVGGGVADEEDLFLSAGDGGVEQVALEHHEVRLEQRHDDDGVFTAL